MIGKLFLQFKTCPCIEGSTFILANSIEHECSVKVAIRDGCKYINIDDEYDDGKKKKSKRTNIMDINDELRVLIEDNIEDIIRQTNCTSIGDDEYAYDIEYSFKELKSSDYNDIEYDLRVF